MTKCQLLREFKHATETYLRAKKFNMDNGVRELFFNNIDTEDFYEEYRLELAQELKDRFGVVVG